ncbi:HAD family hydrolase [Parasulfuritortus cantonensis]|uniref:HAD family hydrolase n=1 Tax=Parasulfuritortus cantonensis TaxID=2528202 RepID=UPI00197DDE01|nr:HAD family hydrolase [Parasulfuritortus cantonensis]
MFIAGDWQGREAGDLAPALAGLAGLRLQEAAKQNRHKLSYYTPLLADPAGLLAEARARLAGLGAAVNLVWSVDEAAAVGLLDVLPASAGKLHALAFLAERLELGPARTLFAGDSGNDLEVLAGPFPAVLVANATASVRHQARALAAANGTGGRLYLAEGGWRGLNGNYSAGILEGLAHFLPEYLP